MLFLNNKTREAVEKESKVGYYVKLSLETGFILGKFMIQKCFLTLFLTLQLSSTTTQCISFEQLVQSSAHLDAITPFPTKANRIATIAKDDISKQATIVTQAQGTRLIMHKNVMTLIKKFLAYKKRHGTRVEKKVYKHMDEDEFINRLITKRPLMFMTERDQYLLRNGKRGSGGFEIIGTDTECAPLVLEDYLSYDEMQIAALIGVSSPTYFINNGSRTNKAVPGVPGSYQETGVYVGLVGARFEKDDLMESQHVLVSAKKSMAPAGLRTIWESFYGESLSTFKRAIDDTTGRYIKVDDITYFDTVIYKKRLHLVIEPFLVDANKRGEEAGQKVYCHVVGLGLGVWQRISVQAQLMLDVYADILQEQAFPWIADIDFSWFPPKSTLAIHQKDIKIHFSQRNPADKLGGPNSGQLLVAMYAWDGNAYPGNEYWTGQLTASGDPAAACCSTIAELQNPLINTNLTSNNLLLAGC